MPKGITGEGFFRRMKGVEARAVAKVDKEPNPNMKESRTDSGEQRAESRSRFVSDRMTREEVLAWQEGGKTKREKSDPALQSSVETEGVSIGSVMKTKGVIDRGIRRIEQGTPKRSPQKPRYKDHPDGEGLSV